MKKTILILSLSIFSLTAFSQNRRDTTVLGKRPEKTVAAIDSTPTYHFKLSDINTFMPLLSKEVYKKGWDNVNLVDIFTAFVGYLEQQNKVK